jgi:hypothetical protein
MKHISADIWHLESTVLMFYVSMPHDMKGLWSNLQIYTLILSMMTSIKPTAGQHILQDMFGACHVPKIFCSSG